MEEHWLGEKGHFVFQLCSIEHAQCIRTPDAVTFGSGYCHPNCCKSDVPAAAPRGITTVLIVLILFGSLNLFAVSLLASIWPRFSKRLNDGHTSCARASYVTVKFDLPSA